MSIARKPMEIIPVPPDIRRKASPEMILPPHDFGAKIGTHEAISLRDLWLVMGISDDKMREIDAARKQKGLEPMFGDE